MSNHNGQHNQISLTQEALCWLQSSPDHLSPSAETWSRSPAPAPQGTSTQHKQAGGLLQRTPGRFLPSFFLSSCPYLEQNYGLPLYLIFVDLKSKEEMIWLLLLLPSSSISTFYRYFWSSTFSTFVNANANGRIWKRYWNNWSIEGFTFRSNKSVRKLLGQNTTLTWNYSNPGVFEKSNL